MCVCSVTQSCPTLCHSWTVTRQAPLSMEFSRQEYWSGLLLPTPQNLPDPGIKPMSPASPPLRHLESPSVQFSGSIVSNSLRPHESQHARPPCPSPTPGVYPNSCPSSRWCLPAISSSIVPFSSCPNPSQHQGLFQWVNSSHEVAKGLEFQLQHQSFQWTPRTNLL